jgi:hypothetical protein
MIVEFFGVTDIGDTLAFVARCHEQEQLVVVPVDFWVEAEGTDINIGPVFGD